MPQLQVGYSQGTRELAGVIHEALLHLAALADHSSIVEVRHGDQKIPEQAALEAYDREDPAKVSLTPRGQIEGLPRKHFSHDVAPAVAMVDRRSGSCRDPGIPVGGGLVADLRDVHLPVSFHCRSTSCASAPWRERDRQ